MRVEVTVQAIDDTGVAAWGYHHVEKVVPASEDAQENALRVAEELLSRVTEAEESVKKQAQTDIQRFPLEQMAQEETADRVRKLFGVEDDETPDP
jgi:hypothetical protein